MAGSSETVVKKGPTPDQVFDALGCAVAVLDESGIIVATNASWRKYAGALGAEGRHYLDAHHANAAHDLDLVLEEGIRRVLDGRTPQFELEYPVDRAFGRQWHLLLATPIQGDSGGAVVAHIDVTAHHDVEDILDDRAHRDALTGLPNRRAITQRLGAAVQRHRHEAVPTSVVFLDLDGFKSVNDTLGHDVGDEVLAAVSRRFLGTIRGDDMLGRWGGDEFVIIVAGSETPGLRSLAARLHDALAQPVSISGHRAVMMAVSIGAADVGPHDTADDVLARADAAMFEAKRTGQNFVLHEHGLEEVEG